MTTIALLGTGLLGSGMVERLLAQGHQVRIWNRSPSKLAALVRKGAHAAADPAAAVRGAERVHLVLAEDDAVDAVVAALRPGLGAGVPVIDHSTNLPARVAARFAALRGAGVPYVPAPVFMSPQHAREAGGLMLLSAPAAEAEALSAALQPMTGTLWYLGERPELPALYKLAGNALLVSLAGALGDVLSLGRAHGVPPEQLLALFEVFKPGTAVQAIGQRVVASPHAPPSFELGMARKDVRLMIEAAGNSPLIVLPALAAAMDRALAKGHGAKDYAVFAHHDG